MLRNVLNAAPWACVAASCIVGAPVWAEAWPLGRCASAEEVSTISKLAKSKGDFEKTVDFNRRVSDEILKIIPDGMLYCEFSNPVMSYDADREELFLIFSLRNIVKQNELNVNTDFEEAKKVLARKMKYPTGLSYVKLVGNVSNSFFIPMSPNEARLNVPSLKFGFVASIVSPWGGVESGSSSQSDGLLKNEEKFIFAKIGEIIAFNSETGLIVRRFNAVECRVASIVEVRFGKCR